MGIHSDPCKEKILFIIFYIQLPHMGYLDQEKITRIKQVLKWRPRGMTISDLSSHMKLNRNLVAKYLEILLISGQVRCRKLVRQKSIF